MGFKPAAAVTLTTVFETAPYQLGIGGRVSSRWLQAPATTFAERVSFSSRLARCRLKVALLHEPSPRIVSIAWSLPWRTLHFGIELMGISATSASARAHNALVKPPLTACLYEGFMISSGRAISRSRSRPARRPSQ